jgi:hypothetical protein
LAAMLLLAVVSVLFSCSISRRVEAYEKKIDDTRYKLDGFGPSSLLESYMEDGSEFPESLNEVYRAYKDTYPDIQEDIEKMTLIHLSDPFSKTGEWFGYFPIYDPADTKIVSYLLLSAGIDGKLDNKLAPGEKLHMDDWAQKLALYNPEEYDGTVRIDSLRAIGIHGYSGKLSLEHVPPYNAQEEKSGTKDLLIYIHHLGHIDDK